MAETAEKRRARRQLEAYDAAMFPWLKDGDRETILHQLRTSLMTQEEREAMWKANREELYRQKKVTAHG